MVDQGARANIERLNEKLEGQPYKLALVSYDELEFLEKNARYMTRETFGQLVENIKRDGGLSSVPFCVKVGDRYRVLSGNHRLQAAKQAGIDQFLVLYTDKCLSRQQQTAIQLSHNALQGQDDLVLLRELYAELDSVELKCYAGLDDKTLQAMESMALKGLAPEPLEYRIVQLLFLPSEAERLARVLEDARAQLVAEDVHVARMEDFERAMDAVSKIQASYNIRNSAVALMLVLDIFERHQDDLSEGWDASETKNRSWVPMASIFGGDKVPVEAARVIRKAVERMLGRQEISAKDAWRAVELWAADYLSGA